MRFHPVLAMAAVLANVSIAFAAAGDTELVSVRQPDIAQLTGTRASSAPSLSASGRYVAFTSEASDLVPGDTNAVSDIFVYDRETDAMERVSVRTDGTQAGGASTGAVISADGRFVAFESDDSSLVPIPLDPDEDPENINDGPAVFLHDRQTHTTIRVAFGERDDSSIGVTSMSADSRYIATETFDFSNQPTHTSLDVYDGRIGKNSTLELNSICSSIMSCEGGALSADGNFMAFVSRRDTLDGHPDPVVFLLNRRTGQTRQITASDREVDRDVDRPSISADGRFVAFGSSAPNLVPNDTNLTKDVFLFDRITGVTTRVSVNGLGVQGNADSGGAVISADGDIVAFVSRATNLVSKDRNVSDGLHNFGFDVFVHFRSTGQTYLVSRGLDSLQANADSSGPAISADGSQIAFDSRASNLVSGDVNSATDVVVRDRARVRTTLVSRSGVFSKSPPGSSYTGIDAQTIAHGVSASGRYVAFISEASSLVSRNRNAIPDIFVRDRARGKTVRVTVSSGGAEANSASDMPWLSDDGRYVAFGSFASNLVAKDTNGMVDIFVRDLVNQTTARVSVASGGRQLSVGSGQPSISGDGRYVVFTSPAADAVAGDTNNASDIFLHDRQTGLTRRVSVDSRGNQANGDSSEPVISANGRYVAFISGATNLTSAGRAGIYVHDLGTGKTTFEDAGSVPSLSADGRFVAFEHSGIFVRDRAFAQTRFVANGQRPSISADGRYITFDSSDDSLTPPDANNFPDVYLYDRVRGLTTRVSVDSEGAEGVGGSSSDASISADGRYVVFTSGAQKLDPGDKNGFTDVFIHQTRD